MRSRFVLAAALVLGFTFAAAPSLRADDAAEASAREAASGGGANNPAVAKAAAVQSAAELLPPTTLFYVEVQRPAELIRLVLDHPLRKRLEQSPDYQKAFEDPKFKEFQAVVEAVEKRANTDWRTALETTTAGGLALGFDAMTQGVVILARTSNEKTTADVRDALFALARDDAQSKGKPDPIETLDYRGFTAHQAGESIIATVGPWLVVSNKPATSQAVADLLLDGGPTLSRDEAFTAARKLAAAGPGNATEPRTAWSFVRMDPVRLMHAANPAFDASAKSDNPVAELLFGGLAGPLRNAPYVVSSLNLDRTGVRLTVSSPHDKNWTPKGREFFFAPAGQAGGADQLLRPKNTLLSFTTYRDLAAWWQAGPDTYTEGVAAKMAQADSGLSTFLGGKSFGTDVLGAFAPQFQFVVAAQDYDAAGVPAPAIKLPAGAMVFRLREDAAKKADVKKHFRIAFQSIVALANLDAGSKGRPLLEMRNETRGKATILYATYEAPEEGVEAAPDAKAEADVKPERADAKPQAAKAAAEKDVHYNFSPALVMTKDRLMFCSTRQLAEELADLAEKGGTTKAPENTLLEFSAKPIADLLADNREQLIAQNMLEKGHSREQAEKEVDVFITLVKAVSHAKLSLTPTDNSISIDVEVRTEEGK